MQRAGCVRSQPVPFVVVITTTDVLRALPFTQFDPN